MDEIESILMPVFEEREENRVFPLTAVVAHEEAKRAIILSLINPGLTLLLYGERGLGKKTMMISASNFVPQIESTGCSFNCDPHNQMMMCTDCQKGGWNSKEIKMPFTILPYTVSREMLLGIGDVHSSVLGGANRGILAIRDLENYSDEVVDSIFSVLRNRKVSMDSFSYPAFFQTIATYNGVPGDIMEKFVLKVRVEEVSDIEERIEILRRVEMFRKDAKRFQELYRKEEEKLRQRIEEGRSMLKRVGIPERISSLIKKEIEEYGLKKDYERRIVIASTANAAYEGRLAVSEEDVRDVARMILPLSRP